MIANCCLLILPGEENRRGGAWKVKSGNERPRTWRQWRSRQFCYPPIASTMGLLACREGAIAMGSTISEDGERRERETQIRREGGVMCRRWLIGRLIRRRDDKLISLGGPMRRPTCGLWEDAAWVEDIRVVSQSKGFRRRRYLTLSTLIPEPGPSSGNAPLSLAVAGLDHQLESPLLQARPGPDYHAGHYHEDGGGLKVRRPLQ